MGISKEAWETLKETCRLRSVIHDPIGDIAKRRPNLTQPKPDDQIRCAPEDPHAPHPIETARLG